MKDVIDETDVRLAQKGDKAAFTRLIKESQNSLYRIAKGILNHEEDCADAIQEAIIKSYNSIHKVKKPQYFKTWLTRIVINQCYDLLKQRKKIIPTESVEPLLQSQTEQAQNDYYQLSEGLDNLNTMHRTIITLFYYEQLTIQEISEILKVREGTVKSRLNRARNRLADYLEKDEAERGGKNGSKRN
ncbi:sigma-70 family RNA polymerase sigma factor [Virgibacillus sp. DJP39]|uniref:sigma-70 family RNA polymerase sigma factor n=1 Tax=Virgibacillus sp. DJP39 TaxID=3409790 RepID=UPI003BB64369